MITINDYDEVTFMKCYIILIHGSDKFSFSYH